MNIATVSYGLLALLFIAFAGGALLHYHLKRKDSEQAAKQSLFYRACRSAGMFDGDDLSFPDRRQRIVEIAEQHGLSYSSLRELGCILDEERISYEARRWSKE